MGLINIYEVFSTVLGFAVAGGLMYALYKYVIKPKLGTPKIRRKK